MKHSDRVRRTEIESFIVGGRVTGPSHMKAGKGCDDAFAWISLSEDAQILAVADGAGSVTGTSAWGSWAATQFVTWEPVARSLVNELSVATDKFRASEILKLAFIGALNNVRFFGDLMGLSLKSMNTTLCVAVMIPGHTYVAQIGDGIVAIMGEDKAETVLIEPKGDSAATDTYFLQLLENNSNHEQWRFEDFGPVPAIALSTDGLRYQATSITEGYAAYPGLFEGLWTLLEAGKLSRNKLEDWLDTKASQSDPPGDDKTLLVAIRPPVLSDPSSDGIRTVLRDCSPEPSGLPNSVPASPPKRTDASAEYANDEEPQRLSVSHQKGQTTCQDRRDDNMGGPGTTQGCAAVHATSIPPPPFPRRCDGGPHPRTTSSGTSSLFERIFSLFRNFLPRFFCRNHGTSGDRPPMTKQWGQSSIRADSSSHYEETGSQAYDDTTSTRPTPRQQICDSTSSSRPNPGTEKRRPRRPRPHW